jgi:WD domain, G-beta repeat
VRLWEVATGKEIRTFNIKGNQERVFSVAFAPDGRTVAAGSDNQVQLWDLLSGDQLPPLVGHRGPVNGLTFSPEGRALASVSGDTTGLVWDLTYGASLPGTKQRPDALKALWTDLANQDAVRVRRAVWTLVATPDQSVSLLRDRLRPAAAPDPKHLALVADLDAANFEVRQKAYHELEKLGADAESTLLMGLEERPSLELRRRLKQLLESVTYSRKVLRRLCAVEVLERVDTSEAREVLKTLAAGAPGCRLTQEAQAALDRLNRARRP